MNPQTGRTLLLAAIDRLGVGDFTRRFPGTSAVGAALGTVAVGGALLILGLIQWWGEVFPHWLPFLGGKRVPIALAVIPATLVSILVTTAGLMFVRLVIAGNAGVIVPALDINLDENWATLAPELLWPLWDVALGAATLAYYYRRRRRCLHCDRG